MIVIIIGDPPAAQRGDAADAHRVAAQGRAGWSDCCIVISSIIISISVSTSISSVSTTSIILLH